MTKEKHAKNPRAFPKKKQKPKQVKNHQKSKIKSHS